MRIPVDEYPQELTHIAFLLSGLDAGEFWLAYLSYGPLHHANGHYPHLTGHTQNAPLPAWQRGVLCRRALGSQHRLRCGLCLECLGGGATLQQQREVHCCTGTD